MLDNRLQACYLLLIMHMNHRNASFRPLHHNNRLFVMFDHAMFALHVAGHVLPSSPGV